MKSSDRAIVALESLEARKLLSAELLAGGELLLIGTNGPDAIVVEAGAGNGQVLVSGVNGVANGTAFDQVNSLTIRGRDGNDSITVDAATTDAQGNPLVATIEGGKGSDEISSGSGDDSIKGGGGNDEIDGGDGNDVIKGNAGDDDIDGGNGNDRVVGGDGNDNLNGGDGNDRVLGNTNHDELEGGDGDDRLVGGAGNDELDGGDGNDELFGKNGRDDLFGGPGNDMLFGLNGLDNLFGEAGDDFLKGNAAKDSLHGGPGNDTLEGGAGAYILHGGLGNDSVTGNGGSDNFRAKMFERNDFGEGDKFFSADAGNGEDFAVISDEIWDEIDRLDDEGLFNAVMWRGVDGSQELLAQCAGHREAVNNEFDSLSDDVQGQIGDQIDPLDDAFDAVIGQNYAGLTGQAVLNYYDGFLDIDAPGNLRDLLVAYVDCIESNATALNRAMAGFRELGIEGLLNGTFDDALFDDILL